VHLDEQWGFFEIWNWGEHLFPGISEEGVLVCLMDPDNITWQELRALGLVPVGIGGKDNPFDEHGRVNASGEPLNTCAAMLVERGYDPNPKTDKEGHREYLNDPAKRGLGLLNRHKFFGKLYPYPDVYIHAIDTVTKYIRDGDRKRVLDKHAAGTDVKDRFATYEDLSRGKLRLPLDMALPVGFFPSDPREAANFVATQVVNETFDDLWLYLTRGIAFADCIRRIHENPAETRKFYIDGIKPPMWLKVLRGYHPASSYREIVRVLRYLGADVTLKRSPEGHIHIGLGENIWKIEEEEQMTEDDYREEKDLKRKRIKIELKMRRLLIALRRLEFAFYGDKTVRTDQELGRASLEGSMFSTPSLKAGYILWGSTQAGQGTIACPLSDEDIITAIVENLEGEVVEVREMSRRQSEPEADREEDAAKEGEVMAALVSLSDMPVNKNVM
jgi:hypothetical protein